jgi:rare lipoprotein A
VYVAKTAVLERNLRQSWLILAVACGPSAPATTPTPTPTSAVTSTSPSPSTSASASATASVEQPPVHYEASQAPIFEHGLASWYGAALAGHKTASGAIFDPALMTAAHRTLKLGTMLEVKRTDNGRIVHVKVNDRGPMSHRFVIDLSSGAARDLGMLKMGVAPVELRILK